MEQGRSTNQMQRKETRLEISIFIYILDPAVHDALLLYKKLKNEQVIDAEEHTYRKFKRTVLEQLIQPRVIQNIRTVSKKRKGPPMLHLQSESVVGMYESTYMLMENKLRVSNQ